MHVLVAPVHVYSGVARRVEHVDQLVDRFCGHRLDLFGVRRAAGGLLPQVALGALANGQAAAGHGRRGELPVVHEPPHCVDDGPVAGAVVVERGILLPAPLPERTFNLVLKGPVSKVGHQNTFASKVVPLELRETTET